VPVAETAAGVTLALGPTAGELDRVIVVVTGGRGGGRAGPSDTPDRRRPQ